MADAEDVTALIADTIQEGLKGGYPAFQTIWQERTTDFEAIILALTKLFAVDTIITKGMLEASKLSADETKDMKKWVIKGVLLHHIQTGFMDAKEVEQAYPGILSKQELTQALFVAATGFSSSDPETMIATLEKSVGKVTKPGPGELN